MLLGGPRSDQIAPEQALAAVFQRAGAVSPRSARSLAAVGIVPSPAFAALLARGIVREGAPGTYYLYPAATAAMVSETRQRSALHRTLLNVVFSLIARILLTAVFWIVVVLFPIFITLWVMSGR